MNCLHCGTELEYRTYDDVTGMGQDQCDFVEELYCPNCCVFVDLDEYYDDDDGMNDPCFDCDDAKMPFAARCCEDCPHGPGKSRDLTEAEQHKIDTDDDASWRYDMWGPDSI